MYSVEKKNWSRGPQHNGRKSNLELRVGVIRDHWDEWVKEWKVDAIVHQSSSWASPLCA